MVDLLNVIESKDTVKRKKIEFEDKNLENMTTAEHANILREMMSLFENSEDITEDESQIIDKIKLSSEKKIMALGYIVKQVQDSQELIDYEIKFHEDKIAALEKRKSVLENRISSWKWKINEIMLLLKKKKLEGFNYVVKLQSMPDKLMINADANHTRYYHLLRMKPTSFDWDMKKCKEWAKENESDDFRLVGQPSKLVVT